MAMRRMCLFVLVSLLTTSAVHGKYRQTCDVQYMTEIGWSTKYTVDVTFMTGFELNEATSTYNYSAYSVYAIIFWDQAQATVIKLTTMLVCGTETERSCIQNSLGTLKGEDQDDDEWKICTTDFCY